MKEFLSKRNLFVLILLAGLFGTAYIISQPRPVTGQAPLTDIADIETLRDQFDRDAGQVRLVILLSPT